MFDITITMPLYELLLLLAILVLLPLILGYCAGSMHARRRSRELGRKLSARPQQKVSCSCPDSEEIAR